MGDSVTLNKCGIQLLYVNVYVICQIVNFENSAFWSFKFSIKKAQKFTSATPLHQSNIPEENS